MRAVDILLKSLDPETDTTQRYDKKTLGALLSRVARERPDDYKAVLEKLSRHGRNHAYFAGTTMTLDDMRPVFDKSDIYGAMHQQLEQAKASVPEKEFPAARQRIWEAALDELGSRTQKNILGKRSGLGSGVLSGARGSPLQMRALISASGLYTDFFGNPVPYFGEESFGEGIRPMGMLAGSFGARKSVVATKRSTADAGDLSKQLANSSADVVVTEEDCGTANGLLMQPDEEIKGGVLLEDVGDLPAGTMVDAAVQKVLRKNKRPVKIRSALTCSAEHGVCSKCLGRVPTETGWAPIGYSAGITSSNAVGEPLAQMGLNCLAVGTRVRMADGTVKPIEAICKGDAVLGANLWGITFPVEVTAVWDQGLQPVSRFSFTDEATTVSVVCTKIHELLVYTGEESETGPFSKRPAGAAGFAGAVLPGSSAPCAGVEDVGEQHCWDISVDHPDMLFVLENGLIVSNTKHTSGAFSGGKRQYSGVEFLKQFVQSPETFADRQILAEDNGRVVGIEDAPQGGWNLQLESEDGKESYQAHVPAHLPVTVKVGDTVEAGEPLSEGLADVEDIIRLRGLGEGRMYYARRLGQMLEDSGVPASRLNLEAIARSAVDHVTITDEEGFGPFLPDEVVSYAEVERRYEPPEDAQELPAEQARGLYLHKPYLNYTIGTKLLPSMVKQLRTAGYNNVVASPTPPPFAPAMSGLRRSNRRTKDWLARQSGSWLGTAYEEDAGAGRDTNVLTNVHYAPALAYGVNFGKHLPQ